MFPQRDALIRLLSDDDFSTVNLVKEQITTRGPDALDDLRDLLKTDDEKASGHVSAMIAQIEQEQASGTFTALCRHFGETDNDDIEVAMWKLAGAMIPAFEWNSYGARLDAWGRQLRLMLESAISDRERVEILSRFLAGQHSFRGNTDDYYHPRNSYLPSVIDTRAGIPITLCLLYMLVARRAGMIVEGVNLPGHFIARHGDVFFDPYHLGKILLTTDCREILARQNLEFDPDHFATASSHQILVRTLANLLFIFQRRNDEENRQRVLGWLNALDRKSGRPFAADE